MMMELVVPVQTERSRVRRRALKVLRRQLDLRPEGDDVLGWLRGSKEAADAVRTLDALGLTLSSAHVFVKREEYTEAVHCRFIAFVISKELLNIINHCANSAICTRQV